MDLIMKTFHLITLLLCCAGPLTAAEVIGSAEKCDRAKVALQQMQGAQLNLTSHNKPDENLFALQREYEAVSAEVTIREGLAQLNQAFKQAMADVRDNRFIFMPSAATEIDKAIGAIERQRAIVPKMKIMNDLLNDLTSLDLTSLAGASVEQKKLAIKNHISSKCASGSQSLLCEQIKTGNNPSIDSVVGNFIETFAKSVIGNGSSQQVFGKIEDHKNALLDGINPQDIDQAFAQVNDLYDPAKLRPLYDTYLACHAQETQTGTASDDCQLKTTEFRREINSYYDSLKNISLIAGNMTVSPSAVKDLLDSETKLSAAFGKSPKEIQAASAKAAETRRAFATKIQCLHDEFKQKNDSFAAIKAKLRDLNSFNLPSHSSPEISATLNNVIEKLLTGNVNAVCPSNPAAKCHVNSNGTVDMNKITEALRQIALSEEELQKSADQQLALKAKQFELEAKIKAIKNTNNYQLLQGLKAMSAEQFQLNCSETDRAGRVNFSVPSCQDVDATLGTKGLHYFIDEVNNYFAYMDYEGEGKDIAALESKCRSFKADTISQADVKSSILKSCEIVYQRKEELERADRERRRDDRIRREVAYTANSSGETFVFNKKTGRQELAAGATATRRQSFAQLAAAGVAESLVTTAIPGGMRMLAVDSQVHGMEFAVQAQNRQTDFWQGYYDQNPNSYYCGMNDLALYNSFNVFKTPEACLYNNGSFGTGYSF
jgi:hypothetical protein